MNAHLFKQALFLITLFLFVNNISIKKSKLNNCINKDNRDLVNNLKEEGYIRSKEVEDVMCTLDRADFVNRDETPYSWEPVYIGYGATLSRPKAHAWALEKALEKFQTVGKINILDIGSGSGYL